MLAAPDAGVDPYSWQADQALRRAAGHRGLMVSAAAEVLAMAVVIGVSTLAAGLLKSAVLPVSAMGTAFIDRMPAMLRGFAMHHFGPHGGTVLLLGLIAVIAIAIGAAARRSAALGVAGVAAFALVVAFVTVTRPASHVSDVMPAVIGGLAGVAALLWLVRASAPIQEVTPLRSARGGTRRRTR
jgi:membrane-bound ClpP family serine protease